MCDEFFNWSPHVFIGCIILYDDEFVIFVIETQDVLNSFDEHLWLFIVARYMYRDKRFDSFQCIEVFVGEMVLYFSATNDFEIISELIEYACNGEQHEWHIDPELIEINIMTYPSFISNHDTDIDQYKHRQGSRSECFVSEMPSKPTVENTCYQK